MQQLDLLHLPAQPPSPLRLDGAAQARRMRRLEQLADWRRAYAFEHWQYRVARASGYNREIVEVNYSRALRALAEAFHEVYRSTEAAS